MDTLRRTRRLARLLLAWFALSVVVAMLPPAAHSQPLDVICSASGGTEAPSGPDGGAGGVHGHQHECALCAPVGVLPGAVAFAAPAAAPQALPTPRPALVAARSAAPFGARGPPAA